MFGCGKFDEIKMLRYLEGQRAAPDHPAVETHLMECEMCLREMTELNRIQAETDVSEAAGFKLPHFITVFSGKKSEQNAWSIVRAVVSAVSAKWEPLAETRGTGKDAGQRGRAVSFMTDGAPVTIKIIPEPDGAFWISLRGDCLNGQVVELIKAGGSLPVFSRKADGGEVLIQSVEFGDYDMRFLHETVRINLRQENAERIV